MKRLLWLSAFGIAAPLALTASFLLLVTLTPKIVAPVRSVPQVLSSYTEIYEPQAVIPDEISTTILTADARPLVIRNYLQKYNSELEPFSNLIVEISDKYLLDHRLLVAIAQQESNLCKRIPPDSYNCWGFGIYGDKVTRFESYPKALETVAKTLKLNYIDKGFVTPEEIMVKYTPPSAANGGSWAKGVNQFLAEME